MGGLLALDGLVCRFGNLTALDGLGFEVPAGEVLGFLGPNGAGKTTTMRAIFGLTNLQAGAITWNGAPVGREDRKRFGYMPEERGLYPAMLVEDQLRYLGRLHGLDGDAAAAAASEWMERLGVAERARDRVDSLSHGNQQRVQLAAALLHDPALLVLDEPLAGLDPPGIEAVGAVLVDKARSGTCVLFSSHQLDLVEHLCDSVVIIDHGRKVASGAVDELATSGPPRLRVRVEDSPGGSSWASAIPGATASPGRDGVVHLVLDDPSRSDEVLRAAMAAGRVTEFGFERRKISEVFRDALAEQVPAG